MLLDALYKLIFKITSYFKPQIKKESLILEDSDIHIIEIIPNDVDKDNVHKYISNNIAYTNDLFRTTYFDKPVFIKFKYLNEYYTICVDKLENKKENHLDIVKNPRYLSAVVKKDNENIVVTDVIKEFHGPHKNFNKHIPDAITDLSIILGHTGILVTYNILGDYETHVI